MYVYICVCVCVCVLKLESRHRLLDTMCEPGGIVYIPCSYINTKKGSFFRRIEKDMLVIHY